MAKVTATLTSKGQMTVPLEVRRQWSLQPGDKIGFEMLGPDEARIRPLRRRSILDGLDALTIRSTEPFTQEAIDRAIDGDLADHRGGGRG